ncbi:MAG TPA: hypothetical protein VIV66_01240, partial [Pyrinomonadaceae bacterium]
MRGKSSTCRYMPIYLTVYDHGGSETLSKKELAAGKSQTCRASEWQSHWQKVRSNLELKAFLP